MSPPAERATKTQLASVVAHYSTMQTLTAAAIAGARKRRFNVAEMTMFVQVMQALAAQQGAESITEMAQEQAMDAVQEATVIVEAFTGALGDNDLADLLKQFTDDQDQAAIDRLVWTMMADAARGGQQAAMVATPKVKGHIRYLNPPSCARCVILAGRWYRWSEGFLRHPQCDCVMIPVGEDVPDHLIASPQDAFDDGQILGLSKADTKALTAGADLTTLVNIRQRKAGLTRAGRVLKRGSTLTPEGIFALVGDDRDAAMALFKQYGYLK